MNAIETCNRYEAYAECRYRGMARSSHPPPSTKTSVSPQPTGFSQVHTRLGESGGSGMSVLLSWHEKVESSRTRSCTDSTRADVAS